MKKRQIRVYNSRSKHGEPCILLQGQWLKAAGFLPGDYITVTIPEENHLSITITKKFNAK